ncbi:hypothetical protein UFOVP328_154 [uncultured Caudovirales phage]|uniref:Uncharacterized protein n=1 Tax=uncultured Caudovirales phage TaxID=2100421 RepID=A0A6J5LYY2_9CAUD|nr:hypothetical protein UFOVP328_154 [uncultured Caudovirales phage]
MFRLPKTKGSSSVFQYGNVAKWLMRLLHTEYGVGSTPTITTIAG